MGANRAASRIASAFLKVRMPEKDRSKSTQCPFGERPIFGETVDDAPYLGGTFLFENGERLCRSASGVDDECFRTSRAISIIRRNIRV